MPIQKIKAPEPLQRAVRRRQGILDEIIENLKKLKEGEALRLSSEENFPGRTPRAIYQALWRHGRKHGVQIAFYFDKEKDKVIVTRVRPRA
ncbi:MAG: hypothetical protein ACRD3D_08205 [Terriglobia bacterium]